MKDLIGEVINNFEIQEIIGQGGMGIVYRAYHPDLQRFAAVKVMRPDLAQQPGFYERFLQEARTAARLGHPNIINVINFGRYQESYYLMMDYIDGPNLRQLMADNGGKLNLWDTLVIFEQIAEVLVFAHAGGVLHRDLKPDNILITSSIKPNLPYRAIVTDFGLVKLAHESILQTQDGISIGTPAYMSPEQCRGDELDGRADLYAMGVMLYETLVGQRPFPIRNLFDAARYHSSGKLVPLRAHDQSFSIELDNLVKKLLASDREKRPADAGEALQALQNILDKLEEDVSTPAPQVKLQIDQVLQNLISSLEEEETPSDDKAEEEEEVKSAATPAQSAPPAEPAVQPPLYIEATYYDQLEKKIEPVSGKALLVGRLPSADIVLDRPERYVSRQHCEILLQNNRFLIRDLGSANGTFLGDTKLIKDTFYEWKPDAKVHLGPFTLSLRPQEAAPPAAAPSPAPEEPPTSTTKMRSVDMIVCADASPGRMPVLKRPIIVGRAPDCDIVLNFAQVSKRHCQIQRRGEVIEVTDLNSTNGTYLHGQRLPANTPTIWDKSEPIIIGQVRLALVRQE